MRDHGLDVEFEIEQANKKSEEEAEADEALYSMEPSVRTLMDWLQEHTHQILFIEKQENQDIDRAWLQLDEVGYNPNIRSLDGYIDGPAIILHGRGAIAADRGEAPLPDDRYVIPVGGIKVNAAFAGGITVHTDRAHITIKPQRR